MLSVQLIQPFFGYNLVTPEESMLVAPVSVRCGAILIELVVSVLKTKTDVDVGVGFSYS